MFHHAACEEDGQKGREQEGSKRGARGEHGHRQTPAPTPRLTPTASLRLSRQSRLKKMCCGSLMMMITTMDGMMGTMKKEVVKEVEKIE
jgi:hypothetical protein